MGVGEQLRNLNGKIEIHEYFIGSGPPGVGYVGSTAPAPTFNPPP